MTYLGPTAGFGADAGGKLLEKHLTQLIRGWANKMLQIRVEVGIFPIAIHDDGCF